MSAATRLPVAGGWQRQLKDAVTSVAELAAVLELTPEERAGAERAERLGLPLRITPYYLGLCDRHDPRCPIRMQVVPRSDEAELAPGDLDDPLGEAAHEAAPGLVQRYPDRALLIATDQCAIYCRFCTRSRLVGGGLGPTSEAALARAIAFVAANAHIREVIVSGGDPLAMSTARVARLVERVRAVPHVEIIRLATRVPVCLPERVDGELLAALRPHHPVWVMTHFNHPKELTAAAVACCARLADAGFPVMNQTVLLRGVNDDAAVLEQLFRGLVRARVRPYYLLQMDPVKGSSPLRTPLATGIALMDRLQGRVSGIALPKLVVDTPGGMGKVPIGPDYVLARAPGRTLLRTHRGVTVEYIDPPSS
jgi:lysine 2,3-aminomutase